jgi:uncharacterized protein YqgC (DUF456 family)
MDTILLIIGGILLLLGIAGSILPVLPGPPLGYAALILLQVSSFHPFSIRFLVTWGVVTVLVTVLDYVIPIYGTRFFGGTKRGMWGATAGLIIGIFFLPPIGIIIGPFLGAYIGELTGEAGSKQALKAAFGSFLGFLAGTLMKLILSVIFVYYFIASFI